MYSLGLNIVHLLKLAMAIVMFLSAVKQYMFIALDTKPSRFGVFRRIRIAKPSVFNMFVSLLNSEIANSCVFDDTHT